MEVTAHCWKGSKEKVYAIAGSVGGYSGQGRVQSGMEWNIVVRLHGGCTVNCWECILQFFLLRTLLSFASQCFASHSFASQCNGLKSVTPVPNTMNRIGYVVREETTPVRPKYNDPTPFITEKLGYLYFVSSTKSVMYTQLPVTGEQRFMSNDDFFKE
jgi:hypothetical protein